MRDAGHERRFMDAIDAPGILDQDLTTILARLNDWLEGLEAGLTSDRLVCRALSEGNVLARRAEAIHDAIRAGTAAWSERWTGLEPTRLLAGAFDDKAILLVFGKVNAGKSSICNFLADRFAARGHAVRPFYLDVDLVKDAPGRFEEGVTETTARLQGVCLGGKLVLLDTPGLHSVTPENAALTRRFTDSADGVLWLTNSASPGQVQEFDELSRELGRHKPLLPVITRSDLYEEDEVDGVLVKSLRNKASGNRRQQEDDVAERARRKLAALGVDVAQLAPPISVSVRMAREQGMTRTAMEGAGFERLYAALLAIAGPALAYKRRKPAEMLLHHLEEGVLGTLRGQVQPLLAELDTRCRSAIDQLDGQRERVIDAVWRSVVPTLPGLLEEHAAARDLVAVVRGLSQRLFAAYSRAEQDELGGYRLFPDPACLAIDSGDLGFDDIVVDAENLRQVVGVDYARLHAELQRRMRSRLLHLADAAIEQCRGALGGLMSSLEDLRAFLRAREEDLSALKADLRSVPT